MQFLKLKRVWLGLFCLLVVGLLSSCTGTRTLMMTAPNSPKGKVAAPAITAKSVSDWEQQKPHLRRAFEEQIYGIIPKSFETSLLSSRPILKHDFQARIEEVQLKTAPLPDL